MDSITLATIIVLVSVLLVVVEFSHHRFFKHLEHRLESETTFGELVVGPSHQRFSLVGYCRAPVCCKPEGYLGFYVQTRRFKIPFFVATLKFWFSSRGYAVRTHRSGGCGHYIIKKKG